MKLYKKLSCFLMKIIKSIAHVLYEWFKDEY